MPEAEKIMARVLLVTKTSVWDWHGSWYQSQFQKGALPEWDYSRIKLAHDEHLASVAKTREALASRGIEFREVNVDQQDWSTDDDTEFMLTLGGDGTLLSASHRVHSQALTMIGVRSSGTSVGYLCAGGVDRVDAIAETIGRGGAFKVCEASRLRAEIIPADGSPKHETPPALNDFLYSNANPAATTRYRISLGDRVEEHKSSGLWVSTALGSTAGIYAAGGVMMPRHDQSFQYVVRELYRAPGRNFYLVNGFFNPDDKTMTIENRCEQAIIAADGNHAVTKIQWGDRIKFLRAPSVRIVQA
jgi:NAD+ kinase